MAILTVKLLDLGDVKLTMKGVGKRLGMARHTLPALSFRMIAINVRMGSRLIVSTNIKGVGAAYGSVSIHQSSIMACVCCLPVRSLREPEMLKVVASKQQNGLCVL